MARNGFAIGAASLSADGHYAAFADSSSNLVAGVTNGAFDIFRKDLATGEIALVSSNAAGAAGSRNSSTPVVSADGRFVFFASGASNLVAGDTGNAEDVFRKDLATGEVVRLSVNGGAAGNGDSFEPVVSASGRYAAFSSNADNLAADDTNHARDIFMVDLRRHELTGGPGHYTADLGAVGFRGFTAYGSNGVATLDFATDTYALTGIREVRFADGRLVFEAADPAAQVARLYEAALDRAPDQEGLDFWIDAVRHGQPLSALVSAEFHARFGGASTSNSAFVDQLYLNVLGRAGEPGGHGFWVGSLDRGAASRAEVLAAFSESAENMTGTAALVQNGIWDRSEEAAEVARLYDTVFGRRADTGGLVHSKGALESHAATLEQVADAFTGGAEFRAKYGALGNRDFAEALYLNTLDRAADQAGLDHWAARLDSGVARSAVVLAFSESAEHIDLTAQAIQSDNPGEYGILFA